MLNVVRRLLEATRIDLRASDVTASQWMYHQIWERKIGEEEYGRTVDSRQ